MFKVKEQIIIAEKSYQYLSFPDIIQSIINPNTYFIVYRAGDNHHPTWSDLVVQKSEDCGKTWKIIEEFHLSLHQDGAVWNCPRFSYIDNTLYIICDAKNSTFENRARFITFFLTTIDEGESWKVKDTPFPGMVPDKLISFKNKIFCANHKIKSENNDLIQLVTWSNNDNLWYNTGIMAHSLIQQFCEASVVNMGDYLISYLRDNSGHCKNIYTVKSDDGINWTSPKKISIYGQRVTALRDGKNVIGAYRDTSREDIDNRYVSVFEHNLKTDKIEVSNIDCEKPINQYHFGYTGISKLKNNSYLLVYYIKKRKRFPYIKLVVIKRS